MTAADKPKPGALRSLFIGFGPGFSFLLAYLAAPLPEEEKIFAGTAVFMVASILCRMFASMPKHRLWNFPWAVSLIVAMGALALWLHDETFIKVRPTLYYAGGAAFLAVHLLAFRPRLEALLIANGLDFDREGPERLALLLIAFGIGMAVVNELVWRNSSDLFWIGFQIWGPILGVLLFAAGSMPVVGRYWSGRCKVPGTD